MQIGVLGLMPLQAGFKYYIKENQDGFYVMANLGIHIAAVVSSGLYESFIGLRAAYVFGSRD